MKKFQILVFGASTTHGNWDLLGGWVNRIRLHVIKKILDNPEKLHGHVFNLGVPGDTYVELLQRIEPEIKARLFYPETIILVGLGANDSKISFADKKGIFTPEEFENHQNKLVNIAKKYSNKVLFLGPTPVDEKRTNPWDQFTYVNERLILFNGIIKSVCKEQNVEFLDLLESFKNEDFLKYTYDGLHPNSLGHEKIFQIVKPVIEKFL